MEENYDVAGLPSSILRELTARCTKKGFDFQEPGNPLVVNEIERLRVSYERKKLRSKTASAARRKKVKALLAGVSASADTSYQAPAAARAPAAVAKQQSVSPVADTVVVAAAETASASSNLRRHAVPAEAMPAFEEVVAAADTTVSASADRPATRRHSVP